MANLNQFYRGEVITISVTMDDYSAFNNPNMYAYLDDLDLSALSGRKTAVTTGDEITDANYAVFGYETSTHTFTLNGKQTRQLVEGHYTVEIVYGNTDSNRIIAKTNNAFTLVGSMARFNDIS